MQVFNVGFALFIVCSLIESVAFTIYLFKGVVTLESLNDYLFYSWGGYFFWAWVLGFVLALWALRSSADSTDVEE